MIEKKAEKAARCLKVLAHPKRLVILASLKDDSRTVSEINEFVAIPQASLSQHLGLMRDRGLLKSRKQGTSVVYSIANKQILELLEALMKTFCAQ